jgi:hypothetical protein
LRNEARKEWTEGKGVYASLKFFAFRKGGGIEKINVNPPRTKVKRKKDNLVSPSFSIGCRRLKEISLLLTLCLSYQPESARIR